MKDELIKGYEFYKSVQGKKYDKNDTKTKNILKDFREKLGNFTDDIFLNYGFELVNKGMWQNSGNFTRYMWNRYKPENAEKDSNLVIYFNVDTKNGWFVGIGLIDDNLNEFEDKHNDEIYRFLESECEKISCSGFHHLDQDSKRKFYLENIKNYKNIDYSCILQALKKVYKNTIEKFYHNEENGKGSPSGISNKFLALNQVLYGPPGTGKTYNTVNKALEIIFQDKFNENDYDDKGNIKENLLIETAKSFIEENGEKVPDDGRSVLKACFDLLSSKDIGQIKFVTFHQSYGYEEFVEGIKAQAGDEGIDYSIEPGIFKKIANNAEKNYIESKEKKKFVSFDELFEEMFVNKVEDDKPLDVKMTRTHFRIYEITDRTIRFEKSTGNRGHTLSIKTLKQYYEGERNLQTNGLKVYYDAIVDILRENSVRSAISTLKQYILIIDEINRGNISKIFGELITLIEKDKRIGFDETIKITLPYSGKEFGVPKNLYIIGTMNTADRSIALMDTALRRRFEFVEMMPDLSLLSNDGEKVKNFYSDNTQVNDLIGEGVNIRLLLKKINERIEYLYDRDHTIGHSYFMSLKSDSSIIDLGNIFKNKIIPLLQEYFYDDWEKIQMVLGDHPQQGADAEDKFIVEKSVEETKLFDFSHDDVEEQQYTYKVNDDFTEEAYRKIIVGSEDDSSTTS